MKIVKAEKASLQLRIRPWATSTWFEWKPGRKCRNLCRIKTLHVETGGLKTTTSTHENVDELKKLQNTNLASVFLLSYVLVCSSSLMTGLTAHSERLHQPVHQHNNIAWRGPQRKDKCWGLDCAHETYACQWDQFILCIILLYNTYGIQFLCSVIYFADTRVRLTRVERSESNVLNDKKCYFCDAFIFVYAYFSNHEVVIWIWIKAIKRLSK